MLGRIALPAALAAVLLVAAGCASRSPTHAPVEDRGTGLSRPVPGAVDPGNVKQLPGFENAGKPGYYTVKPGDTMIRIGLENGQNWRDIVRWNNLENPNIIEVGQVLRVVPPASESAVVTRPVSPGSAAASSTPAQAASAAKPASAPAAAAASPAPAPAATGDEDIAWIWPAQGTMVAGFDEAKNKGLDIAGKPGDAVIASADGRVVYAGAGLRGYGNLIILKHNNTFLTAYAHNQTLLVKEDQSVKKGQKIAEMGNSDADRVKLHFEIRRQGKPVDPAKYLPAR
ncbi:MULTISPECIES: peptidoglycan DD-metalloendopeptidase family protein [unclassified Polaromonas]|uniref:peptidoglycan DD-metalloendopeptidase family protein n=1 Tax=unclassified Polaromonas TaxID=2638319 RepID=UPI000F077D96|nr:MULTISPECIES: peptidoglycan DD-metalloendopeptidase family protein [unclassified Polaromonas]AYQ29179.1 LysM peptidoglycan-binding domain-containing protein [Polaromonas sp. SP1]QGJ19707.1 peptidoglycan DD-metalloendopeptidase family protein [Polaromonas sp. Pch-P]